MQYRDLGDSRMSVSVLGLGTWPMSGMAWGETDDDEAVRTIIAALDAGINLIDTAEGYGVDGHAEALVGQAIRGRRASVIVATKVSPRHLAPADIVRSLEDSLRRLKVHEIDLYQIHRHNPEIPLAETMMALHRLQEQGKVRAIGVCNFPPALLEEARQYGPLVSCQSAYSLLERAVEHDVLPLCRERRLGFMAHSTLGKNLLSGQIRRGTQLPQNDIRLRLDALFRDGTYVRHFDVVEALNQFAASLGRPVAQVAINWVVQQPGVTTALVGARRAEHVVENVKAVEWQLSAKELAALSRMTEGYAQITS